MDYFNIIVFISVCFINMTYVCIRYIYIKQKVRVIDKILNYKFSKRDLILISNLNFDIFCNNYLFKIIDFILNNYYFIYLFCFLLLLVFLLYKYNHNQLIIIQVSPTNNYY